jgi:hypothetical protein
MACTRAPSAGLLTTDPDSFTIGNGADWIDRPRTDGPPTNGVRVWEDDELYLASVPCTDLICRHLAVDYERLVILDRCEGR